MTAPIEYFRKVEELVNKLDELLEKELPMRKELTKTNTELDDDLTEMERVFLLNKKTELENRVKKIHKERVSVDQKLTALVKYCIHWPSSTTDGLLTYITARLKDIEQKWYGWGYRPLALEILQQQHIIRKHYLYVCKTCRKWKYCAQKLPPKFKQKYKSLEKDVFIRSPSGHIEIVKYVSCARFLRYEQRKYFDSREQLLHDALTIRPDDVNSPRFFPQDLTWILEDSNEKPKKILLITTFGNDTLSCIEYGDSHHG